MENYSLSNAGIDTACERVESFLSGSGVERRVVLRVKLTVEEVLLEYQSRFGENATFQLRQMNRFSNVKLEIIIPGEAFDPMDQADEESEVIRGLLAGIGLAPTWSYKKGKNYTVFISKKKPLSMTIKMLIGAVLAIIVGFGLNFTPEGFKLGVDKYFLTPVTDMLTGLISAVSGPLIFLSVLGSICSMGNIETLGKIGSKTLMTIFKNICIIGIAITILGSTFIHVEWSGSGTVGFSQALSLIYDIVPSNLFEPFITGNALQIIFIALLVGLSMLALSTRVSGVFQLIEQFRMIIQTVMSGISVIIPTLIFLIFTEMISSGKIEFITNSWKIILMALILNLFVYICNLSWVSITKRISPILLLKKAWPTYLIALTTASSTAAFATNVEDANKKFGINKKLVDFGIPLGQVLYMPGYIVTLFCLEVNFAEMLGMEITVPWLVVGLVTNILMSFALPPVPGSIMMGFTIAFTQLGIPMEVMGIALAVGTIVDFSATACNVSAWQITLIDIADSLNMLDKDIFYSKNIYELGEAN